MLTKISNLSLGRYANVQVHQEIVYEDTPSVPIRSTWNIHAVDTNCSVKKGTEAVHVTVPILYRKRPMTSRCKYLFLAPFFIKLLPYFYSGNFQGCLQPDTYPGRRWWSYINSRKHCASWGKTSKLNQQKEIINKMVHHTLNRAYNLHWPLSSS
jgi:hypothetical protein